jgi:HSP20 family molecular chaperone IbpA
MEDNLTERSLMEKQENPLTKWIVFFCALLLVIIVLQVAILVQTNSHAMYQPPLTQAESKQLASIPTPNTTRSTATPWEEPRIAPGDWPAQMDMACREAQRIFDGMDSRLPPAFASMTARDPFTHFDEGWDLLAKTPTMDMREHSNHYIVQINLATLNPSNIEATLSGRILTISSTANELKGRTSHSSRFETRVQIPGPVGDPQAAQAVVTNGILTIMIPKGQLHTEATGHGTEMVKLKLL